MIHDFAKSPRAYTLASPRVAAAPAVSSRRLRGRWLVLIMVAASGLIWWLNPKTQVVEPEYTPGAQEASEYQAALEEQTQAVQRPAKPKAALEVSDELLEHQRVIAEFQEKLKSVTSAEPEFGFYDSLAGSSWSVPVQRGVYVTEEDRKRANQRYMLQAASVRDLSEAQRTVQKLRQLGLQAHYSDGAGGWYRVNVGPFDNVSKMNKAEDVLVSLRMMPLKRKL